MADTDHVLLALRALRERLALDEGLGVGYMGGLEHFDSLLKNALRPSDASGKTAHGTANLSKTPPRQETPATAESASERRAAPVSQKTTPPAPPPPVHLSETTALVPRVSPESRPEKESLLEPLRLAAMECQGCGLCARRTNVVWGEGDLDAEVMFIGEGPGRDEDLEGRPFVGRSGRLLTDIIEKGMKQPRSSVYIANVVKCRPPGNRDPRPEEVAACARYLEKQIEVIAPRVIVAVGGVAGCALLNLPPRTPGLRGRWHEYRGLPLRVIFHPSYLLRQRRSANDRTKADLDTWNDIQEVMRRMRQ